MAKGAMEIVWNDDCTLTLDPAPKRVRKLTATRFAAVLGLNRWTTPFQVWCEITGAYREPFEDTVYTLAGKAIEPKQIQYMRDAYLMDDLRDPTDVYGPDYFSKTHGNFFDHPVLGGMWDAIEVDENGNPTTVLEFKTTKRAEDWAEDVPEYYAMQAALYAWLLGCDDVIMVASFLETPDYDAPESYVPSAENTATFEFKVSERYPRFKEDYVRPALRWWADYVDTGTSPAYDERADADYLKGLRNKSLNPNTDVKVLMGELAKLHAKVDAAERKLKADKDRINEITAQLKRYAANNIGESKTATIEYFGVTCKLTATETTGVDTAAMKRDGVYEKYATTKPSARFTIAYASE